jgi:hypothetical protein
MTASLAYALTRMHARFAERPTAEARKRLVAVGDFGHFLQAAAGAGFSAWLTRLGPASSSHQIELSLRLRFRELLGEVGQWLPDRWSRGIDWLKLAPELPALDRLLRGEAAPAWMRQDPLLAALLDEQGHLDRAELARRVPEFADVRADMLDRRWLQQTRIELPDLGGRSAEQLQALLHGQVEPDPGSDDSLQLELAFRRRPEAALKIVAFAALARRDLEFLRGQLTRRRLQQAGGH